MPRLPGDIEHAIGQSDPEETWYGEEGILHRIGLDDGKYFAKQWRGKHYEGERVPLSVSYSAESGRTPVSPFWHKVKFYESKLIHEAFPDSTLEMPIAYDPRITSDTDGGTEFTYDAGRPVTVTREVEGDPELRAERDRIVGEAYEKVWEAREPDDAGVMRATRETGAFFVADREMVKRFGPELTALPSHGHNVRELLEDNINRIGHWSPKSDLLNLLEAGLIPIHAGVNFIPTAESDPERGPKGVYLEIAVADLDRLLKKLYGGCAESDAHGRAQIDRRIERYVMYRVLDELYDDVFAEQEHARASDPLRDPELVNAAFQMYRAIQERIEREGLFRSGQWLPEVRKRLQHLWYRTMGTSEEQERAMRAVFEEIRREATGEADASVERAA